MAQIGSDSDRWIVAIDGGGSKVAGAVAKLKAQNPEIQLPLAVIRHASAGTGSAAVATWNVARANLVEMLERLLAAAGVRPNQVEHVVLMLAGAGRPEDVRRIMDSLTEDPSYRSCLRLTVTSDIHPLLFHAHDLQPTLPSIVVIAGTGSLVASIDATNQVVRAGGWGPVLGDEGSGWRIAQDALKLICLWIDNGSRVHQRPDVLNVVGQFLEEKQLFAGSSQLNSTLIALASDRHLAAQLAPFILGLAAQPFGTGALQIVRHQIHLLVEQIMRVHGRLSIDGKWRLCLTGGLLSNERFYRDLLHESLASKDLIPASVVVLDPLETALDFAART